MADIEERIIRIENKIDKVVDHISSIDTTLACQHESLKQHIHRTELLENAIKPLTQHDNMILGVLKLTLLLAAIGGGIEGIVSLLSYIRK